MRFNNSLIFIPIFLLLISCGIFPKRNKISDESVISAPPVNSISNIEMEKLESTSKKLDQLVAEALRKGDRATEFLASDLYLKASDASIRGDSKLAAYIYKYVMVLKPNDSYVKRKYAVELIRLGELVKSEKILEEVFISSKYKDESIGLVLAGIYTAKDEIKRARKTYEIILKKNPKNEEACVFYAKSYVLEKKYHKANRILDRCEKKIKNSAVFSYYRGKIAIEQNRKQEARKQFSKALKIDPEFNQAAIALGIMYEQKNDYKSAIKIYRRYIKKNPNDHSVLSRLVQAYFIREEYEKAVPYAETLSSLDPNDLNLKVRLGLIYTDQKKYEKAISIFREILESVPESDKILFYLASLYQQIENFEEAVETFLKISESSALFHDSSLQVAEMLNILAVKDIASGKEKNVKRFVTFVNTTASKHKTIKLDILLVLVGFHEANNEYTRAIDILASLRDEKDYGEEHDYYLASLHEKNKDPIRAREVIKALLQKNPNNPHALNFLGYSYLEARENLDEAYELISKAVSLKPDDGYIRDSLGWYYYVTGDLKRALKEIKKAWEKVKTDVVITKHLAIIYQEMKQYKKAKHYFVEALKNCKIESEKTDILKSLEDLGKIRLPASEKSPTK